MKENKLCLNPWNFLAIEADGNCFFCCSIFSSDKFSIGNIFEQNINEIWNGDKAKDFRKDVLDLLYSHCDTQRCRFGYARYGWGGGTLECRTDSLIAPLPQVVHLIYDYSCSQRCIFCRDSIQYFTKEEEKKYNYVIDTKLIPLLSNAKILSLNGGGEIFDSIHSKLLLKKAIEKYDDLSLELWSNGIKFTKENIEALNIQNRIKIAHISVNAASKEVYKKIFRVDNFERVKQNILYLNELKENKIIEEIQLHFIVNEKNYRDMKKFMKFVNTIEAVVSFSPTSPVHATAFTEKEEIYAVHKTAHFLYNDFVRRLKDPIYKSTNCSLDFDTNLKPIPLLTVIKNFINRYK